MNKTISEMVFHNYVQISKWAGKTNGVHLLDDDKSLPYVENKGTYFYFGQFVDAPAAFRLVMTSTKDLGVAPGEQV